MPKTFLCLAAATVVASVASGCAPLAPPVTRAALECPLTSGELRRTSMAPDRRSCLYTSKAGDEVSLRLVTFTGDVEAALKPIQAELDGELGLATSPPASPQSDGSLAAERAVREATEDAKGADKDAAEEASRHDGDGKSERTQIDLPGIHISADDSGKAKVDVGIIHVDASDDGATIHISHDVRMRGHPFATRRTGFRSTYILAKDNLKDGWKAVGYEAGGPRAGPIAVAVVKSHSRDHDGGAFRDIQRLVRTNGGV